MIERFKLVNISHLVSVITYSSYLFQVSFVLSIQNGSLFKRFLSDVLLFFNLRVRCVKKQGQTFRSSKGVRCSQHWSTEVEMLWYGPHGGNKYEWNLAFNTGIHSGISNDFVFFSAFRTLSWREDFSVTTKRLTHPPSAVKTPTEPCWTTLNSLNWRWGEDTETLIKTCEDFCSW